MWLFDVRLCSSRTFKTLSNVVNVRVMRGIFGIWVWESWACFFSRVKSMRSCPRISAKKKKKTFDEASLCFFGTYGWHACYSDERELNVSTSALCRQINAAFWTFELRCFPFESRIENYRWPCLRLDQYWTVSHLPTSRFIVITRIHGIPTHIQLINYLKKIFRWDDRQNLLFFSLCLGCRRMCKIERSRWSVLMFFFSEQTWLHVV